MGATDSRQLVAKQKSPSSGKVPPDPRSPSKEFERTPLRVLDTKLVSDPRSPSGIIQRTPIQMTSKQKRDTVRQTLNYEDVQNN